jgi:hypothetical protein
MKLELAAFVPELDAVQAGLRINTAYRHLWERRMWSFRRTQGLIGTVGTYSTGTVSVTVGATTVTQAGATWTAAMAGRFIRFDQQEAFYGIASIAAGLGSLVLSNAYIGDTALVNASYVIFQHRYATPTNCKHINTLALDNKLVMRSPEYLDATDPSRRSLSDNPIYYTMFNNNTIELWPVPNSSFAVRCYYEKTLTPLSAEADEPILDEQLILDYAKSQAYLQLASSPETGAHYMQLMSAAQAIFTDRWRGAEEADQARLSLPTRVLIEGYDLPYDDDFLAAHDPYDPRG